MIRYYSKKEIILRMIWSFVNPILFKLSPRLCYGWRNEILRMMGAKIGKKVRIYPTANITFPWFFEVKDRTVISWGVKIYNLGRISIGEKTVISQFAHLCGGTHDLKNPGFKLLRTEIEIGNSVWIAADAFIGPNVHIGDNAVIGARAVVMKNVDAGNIVAGNPARSVGMRKT